MKIFSLLFLILIVMSLVAFAQKTKPQAFKFDELQDLQESEWKQKLDRFSEMTTSFPDSALQIIVYARIGTERASIMNLVKDYKNYLRKVKKSESVFVDAGGFRKSQTAELWIVPKGANHAAPTPEEKFKPEKFAEFGALDDDALIERLEEFYVEMMEEPSSIFYIINYGNAFEVAERERKLIDGIRTRCFDRSRLTLVNGGDNGELKTVFWIVPPGAEPPTP